jgi:hypothetical protein
MRVLFVLLYCFDDGLLDITSFLCDTAVCLRSRPTMDILEHEWMQYNTIQYNTMYKLMDVTEFLLQSSFRNPIKFYYIVSLCISCNVIENV